MVILQLFVSNGKLNKDIWHATVVVILNNGMSGPKTTKREKYNLAVYFLGPNISSWGALVELIKFVRL